MQEQRDGVISRREMLRKMGLTLGAVLAAPLLQGSSPWQGLQPVSPRQLRGTRDGQIQESLDGAKSWKTITNFGKDIQVETITARKSDYLARVSYRNLAFYLKSSDGLAWYALDYRDPRAKQ